MIQYEEAEETRKFKFPSTISCDCCGKTVKYNDGTFESYESENFVHIRKEFGYGSEVGDEEEISIDICEQCFIEKFGIELIKKCTK